MSIRFLKGHGTRNDFVVLPYGEVSGELTPALVRELCDRHAGIGADGVLRAEMHDGRWFMDYRNADGSIAEMCGNGIRVFARYLVEGEGAAPELDIATRDGVKHVTMSEDGAAFTVDMGAPRVLGETVVSANGRTWQAQHVSMGNPHAVAFVDSLEDAGSLAEEPSYDKGEYPDGVNVEFVARRGEQHVAMRVHERGSGETMSCGTGACAVMVASALADGNGPGSAYVVDVPGGTLDIEWTPDDRILLTGPAVIVAEGSWLD